MTVDEGVEGIDYVSVKSEGVMSHMGKLDELLAICSGGTELEEMAAMPRGDDFISFTVDDQRRSRDILNGLCVVEEVRRDKKAQKETEQERQFSKSNLVRREQRRDKKESAGVSAFRKQDCRPGAYRSAHDVGGLLLSPVLLHEVVVDGDCVMLEGR